MEGVPFLNGSLFAEHLDDDDLDIPAGLYWSAESGEPGLFTILARYHWTMDEHRPGESEQTLDPELLSNLFERLIAPTEEGAEPQLRQPKGTYYTPADVADEMVKDALTAAVKDHAPRRVSETQLRELFGDADAPPPSMTPAQSLKLAKRIKELRIFDPAVGSGEFLFRTLLALQRALGKLEPGTANPAPGIIRRQLSGQDVHPLAVQITRLRLFVAITASRRRDPGDHPLPNLEARIVCADTLETNASPDWRPDRPAQLDTADPELVSALTGVALNRANWFDAHTEPAKQSLLARDGELRDLLKLLLQDKGELASPELARFADSPLFDLKPVPARTDSRLLFYENPWRGFDIVIGNPPYEALSKSMGKEEVNSLKTGRGYQTTNVGDLYTLFCETALALANPQGGVISLIIPLSIAFGRQQKSLRDLFVSRCQSINLRHYDNIPDAAFNGAPTLKTWKNRQRATIINCQLGDASHPAIKSSGLQRWPAEERALCLNQRPTAVLLRFNQNRTDIRLAGQWPRIPTPEVAEMVQAILKQKTAVAKYASDSGETLTIPMTAYQFIGSIPKGSVLPRGESPFTVADMNALRLVMATLNGHVAHAWWWIFGDGFHLKPYDMTSMTVPDKWIENPQPAIDLGQQLINAIPDCLTEKLNAGTVWQNVNFHRKPGLIAELDKLHIRALGLPEEPLLTHLRIMRSSNSWDYGGQ